MSVRTLVAVLCSLTLAPAVWAQAATQEETGNLQVPKNAKEVLEELHKANQTEIRLAQLAQRKAQSSSVKELAQMIVKDHRSADQQVTQLARQMKISLGEPHEQGAAKKLGEVEQTTRSALESLEGAPFDQLYTSTMVMDHDKDISVLQAARDGLQSSSPQVAQLIDSLLPKLDQHRSQALQALQSVQPKLRSGVGGSGVQGQQ